MTRTPLSNYITLKKLYVEGSSKYVVTIDIKNKSYELISVGKYTDIKDNFDAADYTVLETEKYTCIVQANKHERRQALVNRMFKEEFALNSTSPELKRAAEAFSL